MSAPAQETAARAREAYWEALAGGDSDAAVAVALSMHDDAGIPVIDILDDVVAAAQVEVGRRWAANEWNVAQEHRATSVSEEVVAALATRVPRTGERGTAVVTCVDGEWHSLPSRVVAAVLRAGGWRVHYLGASVPVPHLAQMLHDVGPDVTAVSCSLPTALVRARHTIEASREAGVPVIAGGPGFGPGGRWATLLGADATAPDARRALAVLSDPAWPAFTAPAPPHEPPDRAHELLRRRQAEIVFEAGRRLRERWPGVREYGSEQEARTTEDLGYLVEFLAASLYVDDVELYTGFVSWMAGILECRRVPRPALTAGLEVTAEAVEAVLGAQPRAARTIQEAIRALADPAGAGPPPAATGG